MQSLRLSDTYSEQSLFVFAFGFIVEVTIGRVLGRGGFCVVSEVTKITLKKEDTTTTTNDNVRSDDEHYIHNVVQDRGFMSKHCIRKGKDYRYAIKRMQEASRKDPQTFVNSVVDLAVGKYCMHFSNLMVPFGQSMENLCLVGRNMVKTERGFFY